MKKTTVKATSSVSHGKLLCRKLATTACLDNPYLPYGSCSVPYEVIPSAPLTLSVVCYIGHNVVHGHHKDRKWAELVGQWLFLQNVQVKFFKQLVQNSNPQPYQLPIHCTLL